jgi:hypothetical protein
MLLSRCSHASTIAVSIPCPGQNPQSMWSKNIVSDIRSLKIMYMTFQVESSSPIQAPPSDLGISTRVEKPAELGISPVVKQCSMRCMNHCHGAGAVSFSASQSLMSLTRSPDGPGVQWGFNLRTASAISSSEGVESFKALL